jgi:hypothetical protein
MRPWRAAASALACASLSLLAAAVAPAPAAGAVPAETLEARNRFFGAANVDQATGEPRRDRVVVSWFGVTQFAAAIDGRVVLLDAWVPRGPRSGYVPTTPDEVARLAPERIYLGHAHFDHAADLPAIAKATGALVVGTPEHCDQLHAEQDRVGDPRSRCDAVVPRDAAYGVRNEIAPLGRAEVTVVRNLHSDAKPPDPGDSGGPHAPVLPFPTPQTLLENPPDEEALRHLAENADGADEGGSLLFQFRVGGFGLTWNDSAGPLKEDGQELVRALRALPPTTVQLGAIQSLNQGNNGFRDPRHYIEALRPRIFVPTHHDDYLVGVSSKAETQEAAFRAELERLPPDQRPELRYIRDPDDYLRPMAFAVPVPARPCVSRRRFPIRLRGLTLRRATIYFNGRRVRTLRGRRTRVPIDLRGLPKGIVRVRVVARTVRGTRVTTTRTYRTCTPGRA